MSEPILIHNPDGSTSVVSINDRDTTAEAVASIANATESLARDFSSAADLSYRLPEDIVKLLSGASSDITGTIAKAQVAASVAAAHRNNDTLFPAGRERLANEEISKADSEVTAALEAADAKIEVAEALLYVAARPTMPAGAEVAARADARMALDGAAPLQLPEIVKSLAQRGDAVGALVTDGSWLDLYLNSRGVDRDLAEAVKTLVKSQVFEAAAVSEDPKRAAAGRTAQALVHLRKARVAAQTYRRNKLS
ncbi:hypothetical protein ABZ235_09820 [Streptomyces canus]|uniref:hypothetical protein n=1 Tax=Streptomyces canus TaxID=58343 RepID=UPI0033B310BF